MAFVLPFFGTYRQCVVWRTRTSTRITPSLVLLKSTHKQEQLRAASSNPGTACLCPLWHMVLPPLSIQCHPPFGDRQVVTHPPNHPRWTRAATDLEAGDSGGQTRHLSCSSWLGTFGLRQQANAPMLHLACRCRGLPSLCASLILNSGALACVASRRPCSRRDGATLFFVASCLALEPEHSCCLRLHPHILLTERPATRGPHFNYPPSRKPFQPSIPTLCLPAFAGWIRGRRDGPLGVAC